jgi:Flp pilus assembly protein TadB
MAFTFFRTPKPKQFELKTRYYDAGKDAWVQRRKELGLTDGQNRQAQLRDQMHSQWRTRRASTQKQAAMRRLVIFVFMAAVLIYLLFFR